MVSKQYITCIQCPMGCYMDVRLKDGEVVAVSGNNCGRGRKYAYSEAVAPVRTVTSLMQVDKSRKPLSVKTDAPVPKEKLEEVLKEIHKKSLQLPVYCGDIVIENVCNTGVNVVATTTLETRQ